MKIYFENSPLRHLSFGGSNGEFGFDITIVTAYLSPQADSKSGDILFDVDKRCPAFDNREGTGYKLVSDGVYYGHPALTFSLPAPIILFKLRIGMDRAYRRQMQHFLHLLVGYLAYLSPSPDTCPRLIFKRSRAGITRKLAPIIKASEVVGIYDQVRCYNKPDSLNGCYQFKRGP